MSDEIIKPPNKVRVKFTGSCLKQGKIIFTHKIVVVNIYIFYELSVSTRGYDDYPTLENCLIFIGINMLDMVLDLIEEELSYFVVDLVAM